jgi:hypothetical protein
MLQCFDKNGSDLDPIAAMTPRCARFRIDRLRMTGMGVPILRISLPTPADESWH